MASLFTGIAVLILILIGLLAFTEGSTTSSIATSSIHQIYSVLSFLLAVICLGFTAILLELTSIRARIKTNAKNKDSKPIIEPKEDKPEGFLEKSIYS